MPTVFRGLGRSERFGTEKLKRVLLSCDLQAMAPRRTLWNSYPGGGRLPATAHTTAAGLGGKSCHASFHKSMVMVIRGRRCSGGGLRTQVDR